MYSVAASLHHRLENLNVCVGEEGANNHSSLHDMTVERYPVGVFS